MTNKERRREFMDYLASLADFNNFRPVFGTWWRLNSNSKSGFDDYDNPRNNPTYCENCLEDVYDWPVDYSLGGYWCCGPCYYATNDERERKAKEARIKRGIEYPARIVYV